MNITFDRFIQISTLIVLPVSLALAGHLFGIQMKNAELESQAIRFQTEHEFELRKQDANWRITKSELVLKFMDILTSQNDTERKLGIEALLIALPEDGPRIALVVAQNDPDVDVQNAAQNSLNRQSLKLANDIFNQNKSIRISATQTAMNGWLDNQDFIKSLIIKSKNEIENEDGVWNSTLVMENTSQENLKYAEHELVSLRSALQSLQGREKTRARVNNLLAKIE